MYPRRVDSFHRIPPQDSVKADEDCLDLVLAQHGKNLKHLDLNWFDCQGAEASIGVGGRLASLPLLEKVEKLCVQLVLLFGDLGQQPTGTGGGGGGGGEAMMQQRPVAELLPPNVTELTLEDWWWESLDDFDTFYRWSEEQKEQHWNEKRGYRAVVVDMFKGLAGVAGGNARAEGGYDGETEKMEKLKKVRFFIRTLPTWIPPEGKGYPTVLEVFEEVSELFAKAGVRFEVEVDQPLEMEESSLQM